MEQKIDLFPLATKFLKNYKPSISWPYSSNWLVLSLLLFVGCAPKLTYTNVQGTFEGSIQRYEFNSSYIGKRTVDVWLPDNYDSMQAVSVLYMQDGQMLFDAQGTWNQKEWMADETISRLLRADSIKGLIVVAIWNAGADRHSEYMPQKVYEACPAAFRDSLTQNGGQYPLFTRPVYSDQYLRFIVKELKPFIDKTYNVDPRSLATVVGGSSMGAMVSLYALCEYPEVFGAALCMSTHWSGTFSLPGNPIPKTMLSYLRNNLPPDSNHRIYFDRGTVGLEKLYIDAQREVDALMLTKYKDNHHYVSLVYEGADHTEQDWSSRLDKALLFLLPKNK